MSSSKADRGDEVSSAATGAGDGLALLASLGFGSDSALMHEPKLFVDAPFLAALEVELEEELGPVDSRIALFHIGLVHGARDAARFCALEPDSLGGLPGPESSPVVMQLGVPRSSASGLSIDGAWPEAFEAQARLARLGNSQAPSCALSAGYTSGWLGGSLDLDLLVIEQTCVAAGHERCTFVAREKEALRAEADGPLSRLLDQLPATPTVMVAALQDNPGSATPDPSISLPRDADPEDPAVHVWGPVMVMPFLGIDPALQTIDLLGRDPSMREVRVVVLDLRGELIDDGFGAAGIERIIGEVQAWGAELILTGVSALCEEVIAELQETHLIERKDLPEAIAYAFQIADVQRHLL